MQGYSPAADRQTLIVGAWTHEYAFFGGAEKVGVWELPRQAILDMKAEHLALFNRYLKPDANVAPMPRVRLFVTGADEWRTFDDYPVPGAKSRRLYLHSGGHANSASGDGTRPWIAYRRAPPSSESIGHSHRDPNVGGIDIELRRWIAVALQLAYGRRNARTVVLNEAEHA